jgi:hypothetical protein
MKSSPIQSRCHVQTAARTPDKPRIGRRRYLVDVPRVHQGIVDLHDENGSRSHAEILTSGFSLYSA